MTKAATPGKTAASPALKYFFFVKKLLSFAHIAIVAKYFFLAPRLNRKAARNGEWVGGGGGGGKRKDGRGGERALKGTNVQGYKRVECVVHSIQ